MFFISNDRKKFFKIILQPHPLNKIKPYIMLRKTRARYIGQHVPTLTLKLKYNRKK